MSLAPVSQLPTPKLNGPHAPLQHRRPRWSVLLVDPPAHNDTNARVVVWLLQVGAKQVKVLATDARIAFSYNWYEPQSFDRVPAVDGTTAGGPNSSLCALGDVSRLSKYEGDQFNFTFFGAFTAHTCRTC